MNPTASRLAKKFGVSDAVAEALVAAGYYPRKIRDATDDQLRQVAGMKEDDLAKLRGKAKAQ